MLAGLVALCGCDYLHDRANDLGDTVRLNVGAGIGLAVDAHLTDWISPGIGVASYTYNFGWDDRRVHGTWVESDVINTPRLAYEMLADEYETTASDRVDEEQFIAKLALSSLNLPNERWIRSGGEVTVEYFSLFNFGSIGERQRAHSLTGHLLEGDAEVRVVDESPWRRAFVEIGATAVFAHARIGWNPLETIDLVAGLFGLDPAGDDR